MYKFTMPAEKWDETAPDKQAIRLLIMKHQKFREKLAKKKRYVKIETTRLYCTVTKEQVRASHRRYMSA